MRRPALVTQETLERIAAEQGFESSAAMLYELYVVRRMSLNELSDLLLLSVWDLRAKIAAEGITLRSRGGKNNVKLEITEEFVREVSKHGIPAVAARLGLDYCTVRSALVRWAEKHKKGTEE